MRCQYVEAVCALPGNFHCFECKNCRRRLSLETSPVRLDEFAAKLPPCAKAPAIGVGTRLERMLKRLNVELPADCSCRARIDIMNSNGPAWCRDNKREIVGWMKEDADRRGVQFVQFAARALVERAIMATRRSQERRAQRA